jgi:hypothetical protein
VIEHYDPTFVFQLADEFKIKLIKYDK